MYGYIMIYHIHVYLRNDEPPAQWRWWVQAYLGWYTWNYLPMREPILGAHDIFDCPWSLVVCVHVQDKTHWFCHHDRSMNHYSIISVAPRATKFWTKNFRSRVVFQMRWLMCLMQRFLWIFFTMFSPFFDGWSWCPALMSCYNIDQQQVIMISQEFHKLTESCESFQQVARRSPVLGMFLFWGVAKARDSFCWVC